VGRSAADDLAILIGAGLGGLGAVDTGVLGRVLSNSKHLLDPIEKQKRQYLTLKMQQVDPGQTRRQRRSMWTRGRSPKPGRDRAYYHGFYVKQPLIFGR
jgi:hypothetical protein